MTESGSEFGFKAPDYRQNNSQVCNLILQLGAIAGRLALEERTLVDHPTGRAENVAEHSHMLSRLAPVIAITMYPDLDPGKIAFYANIHDDVEAYVYDTSTFGLSTGLLQQKQAKELVGLQQLLSEYAHIPVYAQLVSEYEEQLIPEARFVRVLDKLLPYVVHFNEGGQSLRTQVSIASLRQSNTAKVRELLLEYPEFSDLIAVRDELTELAVSELYESN